MDNYVGMENYRHWGEQLVRCRKVAILQTERPLFEAPLLTLGAHAQRGSFVSVCLLTLSVTKCCKFTHIKNVNKTCTFLNFDPVGGWHGPENTHATSEVVGRHLDVAIGALMFLSSILSIKKSNTVRNK